MGCLAGGRKNIFPPLQSTRYKGTWKTSPWAAHPQQAASPEDGEQEERAPERGLPRDTEEWKRWQEEDQHRAAKKARREDPARTPKETSASASTSTSTLITKTSLPSPVSHTPASAVKNQQSLVNAFGGGSTKAMLPAGLSKKAASSASHQTTSTSTVTASHAAPRQPQPVKLVRTASETAEASSPATAEQAATLADDSRGEIGVDKLDLRREEEEGEETSFHQAETGKSLGEDEEVLFEAGCTQMVLPPPTHPSAPSPSTSPAKEQPPSFPRGLPTSTPHQNRQVAPAPLSSPPQLSSAFRSGADVGAVRPASSLTKDASAAIILPAATLPSPESSPAQQDANLPPRPMPSAVAPLPRVLDGLQSSPFSQHPYITGSKNDLLGADESSRLPLSQALSSAAAGSSQSPVRGKLVELSGELSTQGSQSLDVGDITSFLEEEMSL